MKTNFFTIFLLLLLTTTESFANLFSLVGGVNYGGFNTATATAKGITATSKGSLGYAAGVLIDVSMLEVGAVYLHRNYTVSITGYSDSNKYGNYIELPLLFRYGPGPVSVGFGGFYDVASTSNYGLTADARISTIVGPFLDVRFNYSLKTAKEKDLMVLLGFGF